VYLFEGQWSFLVEELYLLFSLYIL